MHGTKPPSSPKSDSRAISIRIARDPNDLDAGYRHPRGGLSGRAGLPDRRGIRRQRSGSRHTSSGLLERKPAACVRCGFSESLRSSNASPSAISSAGPAYRSSWC